MSDTSTASLELDVTMLPGRGRLQGLAMVKVTLDGVGIISNAFASWAGRMG